MTKISKYQKEYIRLQRERSTAVNQREDYQNVRNQMLDEIHKWKQIKYKIKLKKCKIRKMILQIVNFNEILLNKPLRYSVTMQSCWVL